MDTKKDRMTVECRNLAVEPGEKVVVGAKQLRKALRDGRVQRAYLAENADPVITEPLEALCKKNRIEYCWIRSMKELGQLCGIEVGAATAAVIRL